jgi:hypothetical protein
MMKNIILHSKSSELVKKSVIEFDLPFLINLPDDIFYVKYNDLDAEISLRRFMISSPGRGIQSGVAFAPDAHIVGDRWGRLAYTKVRIVMNFGVYIKFYISIHDYLLHKSAELVQQIIEVCRIFTGDHYIHNLTRADIMSYNIMHIDIDGNEMPGVLTGFFGSGAVLATGEADSIDADKLNLVKNVLKKDVKIPLEQELLSNARDYYFYGNYKMAVVEAETAFETFIHGFIAKQYRIKQKPESEIKNILDAKTGFKNLLIDHIRILTNFSFFNSTQYTHWEKNTYELRNEIVHQGKKDVTADNSLKAIKTAEGTISFVNGLIP